MLANAKGAAAGLAFALLAASALSSPAQAAEGYWRYVGYGLTPPQTELDTHRPTPGRVQEEHIDGAFQPAGTGAGRLILSMKADDVDHHLYSTQVVFSVTADADMQILRPGQKLHFRGSLIEDGNDRSAGMPASANGKMALGNADYFLTSDAAIGRPGAGAGEVEIPNGNPGEHMRIYAQGYLASLGALGGTLEAHYDWVSGPAPSGPPPASTTSAGAQPGPGDFSGAWSTSEGDMSLAQSSAGQVSGTYSQDNGRISGQVSGGRLTGWWGENGSAQDCGTERMGTRFWGRIDWTLTPDGRRFEGKWSYCNAEPGGAWTGQRTGSGPASAPAASYSPASPSPGGPSPGSYASGAQPPPPPPTSGGYDHAQGGYPDHGAPPPAPAAQASEKLFDNWNTAGCGLTDRVTLDVDRPIHLDRLEVWFNWNQGETQVRYDVVEGDDVVAEGVFVRGSCDPYQTAWCVAQDSPDNDVQPGRYVFRLERGAVCQNAGSGGQGFLRVYGQRR